MLRVKHGILDPFHVFHSGQRARNAVEAAARETMPRQLVAVPRKSTTGRCVRKGEIARA